jgi:quercetin dioxygenase-like cupin family protein
MPERVRPASDAKLATVNEPWGSLNWLANRKLLGTKALTLGRVVIKAGESNPRHAHPGAEELLFLLAGRLEHTVGDERHIVEAGDTLLIPAGVYHNATSIGKEDADMIVAYDTADRAFVKEKS